VVYHGLPSLVSSLSFFRDVQADKVAGLINSRLRIVRPVAWVGYGLAGIGMILFYIFFKYPIPYALQEGLQVVTAVGVGLSLSTPILILQAAATSAWQLTRALGGSIGTSLYCEPETGTEADNRSGGIHSNLELRYEIPIRTNTRIRNRIPSPDVSSGV
jgi:hypothetical protein